MTNEEVLQKIIEKDEELLKLAEEALLIAATGIWVIGDKDDKECFKWLAMHKASDLAMVLHRRNESKKKYEIQMKYYGDVVYPEEISALKGLI